MEKNKKLDWNLVKVIEEVSDDYQGDILIDVLETQSKAKTVCEDCPEDDTVAIFANYLQSKGYGNIRQAVKEFAEKLKSVFCTECEYDGGDIKDVIDTLVKELYGEE